MKTGTVILGTIVSIVLLSAAGALHFLAGNSSEAHYRTTISLMRQIQQLSSDWSVEIARVKAEPFSDFDSLAVYIPRMARLKDRLVDTTRQITDLPDPLAGDLSAFRSAVNAKEERIERFKTGHAVVRNSSRYLPLATGNALRQAGAAGDDELRRSVSAFVDDLNAWLAAPDDAAKRRLAADLRRLREASVTYPLQLANALANLLAHSEVLLEKQVPTEELYRGATSNEISETTDRLVGDLEFELARKETLATWYQGGTLGAVGLLALFWIVLAFLPRAAAAPPAAALATAGPSPFDSLAPPDQPPAPEPEPMDAGPARPGDAEEAGESGPALEATEAAAEAAPVLSPEPDPFPAAFSPARDEPLPAAPRVDEPTLESAMLGAFLIECTARNLAVSAERVGAGMDRLRQSQDRLRSAFRESDFLLEAQDGADPEDEMEAAAAAASGIHREVNRIADVARRLASFEGLPNGRADHALVDVNACIEEAIAATGAEDAATVAVKLGAMPEIFAAMPEIRLMIGEILENSIHAVEGLEGRPPTIKIDTARKNDELLITIIDNGVGLDADRRAKVFQPFYTTRDGAVGLGLTFANHLARKYEGSIRINSLPGQGTVTRITLPAGSPAP